MFLVAIVGVFVLYCDLTVDTMTPRHAPVYMNHCAHLFKVKAYSSHGKVARKVSLFTTVLEISLLSELV